LLAQPGQKAFAAQRLGFPVAVDDEVGKTSAALAWKSRAAVAILRRTSVLLTAPDRRAIRLGHP